MKKILVIITFSSLYSTVALSSGFSFGVSTKQKSQLTTNLKQEDYSDYYKKKYGNKQNCTSSKEIKDGEVVETYSCN